MVDWSNLRAGSIPVSDGLSATLERMIREGQLTHGERLAPERELAEQLGISRTSLREALHELELKGLVDRRPGRGTVVVDPRLSRVGESLLGHLNADERSTRSVMDLRAAIEPPVAARAAQRATAKDIRTMHDIVNAMEREQSRAVVAKLDVQFHDAIAQATHNPHLIRVLRFASEWINESRRAPAFNGRRRARSIAAHKEILASIERRDADGAAAAMTRHIEAVNDLLVEGNSSGTKAQRPAANRR